MLIQLLRPSDFEAGVPASQVDWLVWLQSLFGKEVRHPSWSGWTVPSLLAEMKGCRIWGVCRDQTLAGMACLRETGELWEITYLATLKDFRRQGLMAFLLGEIIRSLPPTSRIWLETHGAAHEARNLYEKLGFREVGRRPRYYRDGGDAVLYEFP